ncbi:MAG: hypothetical protein JKX80_02920 [Candidatus Pacebacteria bacterium]|nr:hypothetical protein [Candidatus Paceibacterota bacterium]
MNKLVLLVVVVLLAGIAGFAFLGKEKVQQFDSAKQSVHVELGESGFEPREVTIIQGGTVTFTTTMDKPFWPASNLHPSHSIYSEFDPLRPLESQETWKFTFNRVGSYNFHDHIRSYFTGVIHVVAK